jgi:hypothetical protein
MIRLVGPIKADCPTGHTQISHPTLRQSHSFSFNKAGETSGA